MNPDKVQAVVAWPIPTTTMGVRGFLGLAGYYRKFIRHFGSITSPLNKILTKEKFQWNSEAEATLHQLKHALTTPPTMRLPDFSQQFMIECDANGIELGVVLTQQNQPIAYFSKAFKGALALSIYEKEMLTIVKVIRKWRPYFLGRRFVVRTNHHSLKYLLEQRITTPA